MEVENYPCLYGLREFGFEHIDGCTSYRFFPCNNLGAGTTKDKIFIGDFTLEKSGSRGVMVLLLGECVEIVLSQHDRDSTGVIQLAASCACPPLVRHNNRKCTSVVQLIFNGLNL